MRGEPVISFAAHEVRTGSRDGASADFEAMLAQLVKVIEGEETRLVYPNPGDWGIDVLIGDLNGRVRVWQAKYFRPGTTQKHRAQIKKSFTAAIRAAEAHKFMVVEWVLCIASSMDAATTQWWSAWAAEQERATGVRLTLWDERKLKELLFRPEARDVRQRFYHSYREPDDPDEASLSPALSATASPGADHPWHGGDVIRFGQSEYLLHDTPLETRSTDLALLQREATADRLPHAGRVWLRQTSTVRVVPAADRHRQALREQARLLRRGRQRGGWPSLVDLVDDARSTTLVTRHPDGLAWQDAFGPGPAPLDRLSAAGVLAAGADVGAALSQLHRRGQQHRELGPASIFIGPSGRGLLRDLGRACFPASPGEGLPTYRAPEQTRAPYAAGPPTDLFQLAALIHHTLTGQPPLPLPPPPVRSVVPWFPAALDALLLAGLDLDPSRRSPDLAEVEAALRTGSRELSRMVPW